MTIQPSTWSESTLYQRGYEAIRTFTCNVCFEEVTVYEQKLRGSNRIYLTGDMEVHPYHAESSEE